MQPRSSQTPPPVSKRELALWAACLLVGAGLNYSLGLDLWGEILGPQGRCVALWLTCGVGMAVCWGLLAPWRLPSASRDAGALWSVAVWSLGLGYTYYGVILALLIEWPLSALLIGIRARIPMSLAIAVTALARTASLLALAAARISWSGGDRWFQ